MKKKIVLLISALLIFCSLAVPSLAWFASYLAAEFPSISGTTTASYFKSGDGSVDSPYEISSPIHLYNLAWLQYIGYFNMGPINNGRAQSYFKLSDSITALDMQGLAIPPIGTTEYPFIGNFNGNGKTITNLTTANAKTLLTKRPSNSKFEVDELLSEYGGNSTEAGAVIGFFGVIGEETVTANNKIYDFVIENITVECGSEATTIGIIAGVANGTSETPTVSNVSANAATVKAAENAVGIGDRTTLSDHALIGECAYEINVDNGTVTVRDPKVDSAILSATDGSSWGSSIAMKPLYTYLVNDRNNASEISGGYPITQTGYFGIDGKLKYSNPILSSSSFLQGTNAIYDKQSPSDITSNGVVYLAGGTFTSGYKYSYDGESDNPTYTISCTSGGTTYYLNASTTDFPKIETGTSATNATKWTLSSEGDLFAEVNGCAVFLTVNNTLIPSALPSENTKWEFKDGKISTKGNAAEICYSVNKDEWGFQGSSKYYIRTIAQNEGNYNYLTVDVEGGLVEKAYDRTGNKTWVYNIINSASTNGTGATAWTQVSNDNGIDLYTTINGKNYYFTQFAGGEINSTHVSEKPQSETSNYYVLIYDNNKLYFKHSTAANNYYVTFGTDTWSKTNESTKAAAIEFVEAADDSNWIVATGSSTGENAKIIIVTEITEKILNFENGFATFIPLEKGTTDGINTGYIVGGIYDLRPEEGGAYQTSGADVRISKYNFDNFDTTKVYYFDKENNVFKEHNSFTTQPGDYINFLDSYNGEDGKNNGYKHFIASGTGVANPGLYGLHFMDGKISTNSLVTIPSAVIKGVTKQNYEVPADSITFNFSTNGLITFYAGTYFDSNNTFFSLHQIIRNSDQYETIKEIKQIYKIYTTSTGGYVYTYSDTEEKPQNADTLVFDTSWITSPTNYGGDLKGHSIYYFEIPVGAGEFALGSVEGKTGAYLNYLDIGTAPTTAADTITHTVITEVITEVTEQTAYAPGVGIGDIADQMLSVTIPEGSTSASFNRDGDTITVTAGNTSASPTINVASGVNVSGINYSTGSNTNKIIHRITVIDTLNTGSQLGKVVFTWEKNDISTLTVEGNTDNKVTNYSVAADGMSISFTWSGKNETVTISETGTVALTYSFVGVDITNTYSYDNSTKTYEIVTSANDYTVTEVGNTTNITLNGNSLTP